MSEFTQTHFPQLHLPQGMRLELLEPALRARPEPVQGQGSIGDAEPVEACQPRFVPAPILRNDEIAPEHFLMRLRAPEVAGGGPGQFVMIRPAAQSELHPLLPRPMAVYRYFPEPGEFEIVYRVIGEGTRVMSERKAGEVAEVVGPLGRAFNIESATEGILVVGRGIGICSITSLAETAVQRGVHVYGLLSGRNPEVVIGSDLFEALDAEYLAVNDAHGTSEPDKLRPWVAGLMRHGQIQQAYVCGSNRLIALTATLAARYDVEVQVSLEAHMACGLGYCHGCATGAFGEAHESPLVCRDGPVFRCIANGRNGHV